MRTATQAIVIYEEQGDRDTIFDIPIREDETIRLVPDICIIRCISPLSQPVIIVQCRLSISDRRNSARSSDWEGLIKELDIMFYEHCENKAIRKGIAHIDQWYSTIRQWIATNHNRLIANITERTATQ